MGPRFQRSRLVASSDPGLVLEAGVGRHLGGDAPFVVVAPAQPEHPALRVAEGGEQVALGFAELAVLGESDERPQVPAHQGLLGEDVAEAVPEAHRTDHARARARPREEPLDVEGPVEEVPDTHLVGTLQVGARERLRDEEALEVRPLEGVPLVRTEAPLHETLVRRPQRRSSPRRAGAAGPSPRIAAAGSCAGPPRRCHRTDVRVVMTSCVRYDGHGSTLSECGHDDKG